MKCFTHSEIIKTNVAANKNYLQPYVSPTSLVSRKHLDIVEDHLCLQRHPLSPRLTTIVELVGSLPLFTTQGVFYVQTVLQVCTVPRYSTPVNISFCTFFPTEFCVTGPSYLLGLSFCHLLRRSFVWPEPKVGSPLPLPALRLPPLPPPQLYLYDITCHFLLET